MKFVNSAAAAAAKSLQSCPTLCNPIDGSPPGSLVPGILQARTLEQVAISFSNAWKWKWSLSVMSDCSRPHGLQPTRLLHPWDFPGKSTGVGCCNSILPQKKAPNKNSCIHLQAKKKCKSHNKTTQLVSSKVILKQDTREGTGKCFLPSGSSHN